MKNGFDYQGNSIEISAGSFGRTNSNFESGWNDDQVAYYVNIEYFEEDGWRDESASEAINLYSSISWRADHTEIT